MQEKVLIGNIQRFCVNDGDGIRTTVFLKGCGINCPWCSNPENKEAVIQTVSENSKTIQYGKYMTCDDLVEILLRDRLYYKSVGGITYSGGEPLLSLRTIESVLQRIKDRGISQWIETSLFAPTEEVLFAFKYIDNFIVDLKNISPNQCLTYLGGDSSLYLENFNMVRGNYPKMIVRIPVIEPYTYNHENIDLIIDLLSKCSKVKVQLFKTHHLGDSKYRALGEVDSTNTISDEKLSSLLNYMLEHNIDSEIISI